MNDYNRRFAKAPRQEFDVHRELDVDDDLDMVFNWREARKVSKSLTVTSMSGITLTDIKSSG